MTLAASLGTPSRFRLIAGVSIGNALEYFDLTLYTFFAVTIGKLVFPTQAAGTQILLARATTPERRASIGNQTGGRVFLFLSTDDFWRDYNKMTERGIEFVREPKVEDYGTVCVFKDLYGNLWDLLEWSDKRDK